MLCHGISPRARALSAIACVEKPARRGLIVDRAAPRHARASQADGQWQELDVVIAHRDARRDDDDRAQRAVARHRLLEHAPFRRERQILKALYAVQDALTRMGPYVHMYGTVPITLNRSNRP